MSFCLSPRVLVVHRVVVLSSHWRKWDYRLRTSALAMVGGSLQQALVCSVVGGGRVDPVAARGRCSGRSAQVSTRPVGCPSVADSCDAGPLADGFAEACLHPSRLMSVWWLLLFVEFSLK